MWDLQADESVRAPSTLGRICLLSITTVISVTPGNHRSISFQGLIYVRKDEPLQTHSLLLHCSNNASTQQHSSLLQLITAK